MPEDKNLTTTAELDAELDENLETDTPVETPQNADEKKYSQADLDAIIEKRLLRERKKAERDAARQKELEQAKEATDELASLKELLKQKDQKIVRQEAAKAAVEIGVDSDFVDAAVALADFSDVELDNNGEVDMDELKDILKSIIDKYPRFLAKKVEDAPKGFIKAGTEQKQDPPANKIEEQIRRAMGL